MKQSVNINNIDETEMRTIVNEHGTALCYLVNEATQRGEYKRTSLDDFKDKADLHNRGWLGSRAEIFINNPSKVQIKEGRGIKMIAERCYAVTDAALKQLEQKFTIAPDW